jgi:hypothetical protein
VNQGVAAQLLGVETLKWWGIDRETAFFGAMPL